MKILSNFETKYNNSLQNLIILIFNKAIVLLDETFYCSNIKAIYVKEVLPQSLNFNFPTINLPWIYHSSNLH